MYGKGPFLGAPAFDGGVVDVWVDVLVSPELISVVARVVPVSALVVLRFDRLVCTFRVLQGDSTCFSFQQTGDSSVGFTHAVLKYGARLRENPCSDCEHRG